MSHLRIKVAALALIAALGASTAHAQRGYPSLTAGENKVAAAVKAAKAGHSKVDVQQQGRDNGAAVGQSGHSNGAGIYQNGAGNTGQVSQNGANNAGNIYQLGSGNTGAITQSGNNNAACLVQIGDNNSAGVTQSGNQSVGVAQNKARSWEFPAEICETHKGQDAYFLRRAIRAPFPAN